MNLANNFTNFFRKSRTPQPFIIYTIDALTATTPQEQSQYSAITFDAAYRYGYRNEVRIPWEALENGTYSTDSVLDNPFMLRVTGVLTMAYSNTSVAANYNEMEVVINALTAYQKSLDSLIILKGQPFFTSYYPIHLKSFQHDVTPDNITLYADMEFQQVRSSVSNIGSLASSNLNNSNSLSSPINSNIVDGGIVSPNANSTPANSLTESS